MKFSPTRILLSILGVILLAYIFLITVKTPDKNTFRLMRNVKIFVDGKKISGNIVYINSAFNKIQLIEDSTNKRINLASFYQKNRRFSEIEIDEIAFSLAQKNSIGEFPILYDFEDYYILALYLVGTLVVIYLLLYFQNDYIFVRDLIKQRLHRPISQMSDKQREKYLKNRIYCSFCDSKKQLTIEKEVYTEGMQIIYTLCSDCGKKDYIRVD